VEGPDDAFCCPGCELAARIIREAGLERYYAERTDFAPRPEPDGGDWTRVPVTADAAGHCEARLVVDGLRCASCVWLTERILERTPGVLAATVSYATGRATLRWDPARVDLATLAGRIAALGYRPRPLGIEAAPDRDLLLRLGVAAFAAMNIMLLAATVYAGWWGNMDPRYAALFRWTTLTLATPVALWCAQPFFAGAWRGLRHGFLHMDLPIALGVAILYGHGLIATALGHDGYLDSLAMLVALLLAGRVLEARGRRRATEAASALAGSVPRTARRLRPGAPRDAEPPAPGGEDEAYEVEAVPVGDLRKGDWIDLGAGEEFPVDGQVVEGSGQVRMALLTGEAAPVTVGPGDRVVAGTILLDGALTVRVEAVGEETVVHRMAAQLRAAQDRAAAPTAADRIAPWFTAATLAAAALTFAGWTLAADLGVAITRTVAVLVVACPCALALSHPLAAAAGLGAAARRGLLLRSSDALLELGRADTAALDKTGTVTEGDLVVTSADDAALRIAAGLERFSTHPVARAIIAEAARRGIPLPRATEVREVPGAGIAGVVDGRSYRLRAGRPGEVWLENGNGRPAVITLGDRVRPDARSTVAALQQLGLDVVLLSGDHPEVAHRIAREAGIAEVHARTEPAAKAAWIAARQQAGRRVLFAGDGLNDGPALARADVGVAMGTGAATSLLVADGLISTASLAPVVAGIRAARAASQAIRSSQRRSIIYNVLAVGAAAAGLVNPLVAAVLMPLSSGMVIWNASRVERRVRREEGCAP
jgi:Cu2+-exporting ATPase